LTEKAEKKNVEHESRKKENVDKSLMSLYLELQWINGTVLLSMWNSNDLEHRTNNISEGN